MTNYLSHYLRQVQAEGRNLIVPYIMAGDHEEGLAGLSQTLTLLAESGAAAVEIGVPFSDPVADGPIIEAAGQRSLSRQVTLRSIVQELQGLTSPIPLLLMTYFNPVYQYGVEKLVDDLKETGVKGLIIPDLPFEHRDYILPYLQDTDMALITLVSLTTGLERQKKLIAGAEGFIYAVAINGVTGLGTSYREDLDQHLATLSQNAPVPVLTGFGVSNLDDVARFNRVSDGVIVGSKIVQDLYDGKLADVRDFVEKASRIQI